MPVTARKGACSAITAKRGRRGFTLIEMVVSLGVLGVATLIIFSLFGRTVEIENRGNKQVVAAYLAEELLADLKHQSARYAWPATDALTSAEFAPITLKDTEAPAEGYPVQPPTTLPPIPAMERTLQTAYSNFHWRAFARKAEPSAAYVEVTAQIFWDEQGRPRSLALTTLLPLQGGAQQ